MKTKKKDKKDKYLDKFTIINLNLPTGEELEIWKDKKTAEIQNYFDTKYGKVKK